MVKLETLSEVAWRIEQLMNRWLSEQKPATSALLDLLTESHRQFDHWCASLKNGTVEIEAHYLLNQIKVLMYGTDEQADVTTASLTSEPALETTQGQETAEVLPVAETGAEAAIRIGEHEVPADLFSIFINEASTHVTALKQALGLSGDNAVLSVTHEAMLAAHTLASTSRALTLDCIAQIGQALERWFNHLLTTSDTPDQETLSHMTTAAGLLDDMLTAIREQQFPSVEIVQAGEKVAEALMQLLEETSAVQSAATETTAEVEELAFPELTTDEPREEDLTSAVPEIAISLPAASLQQAKDAFADLDRELLEVFLEEAGELQSEIGTNLRAWQQQPDQINPRKAVLRALHTLKGSARIAGAQQVSDQAHQMESAIESLHDQTTDTLLLDQLERQFDAIVDAIEHIRASLHTEPLSAPANEGTEAHPELYFSPAAEAVSAPPVSAADTEQPARKTMLRVDAELMDRLINESR